MPSFKYKILEFAPTQNMEKTLNDLGTEGWKLVNVTPVGLKREGYSDVMLGYGGWASSGEFEKIAAYFKKEI